MAIPIGTTARQLSAVAQWVLAAVLITGMLAGWSPGFYNWGAMIGGLAVAFTLMLLWRILCDERGFLGNRIYLPVTGVAVVLIGHVAATGLGRTRGEPSSLAGSLNISMLTQWVLLALGVLVTQNLMVRTKLLRGVVAACGAGMVVGVAAAIVLGHATEIRGSLALLGLAGAAVMLAPLWMERIGQEAPQSGLAPAAQSGASESSVNLWQRTAFRWAWLAMAAAAAVAMAILSPPEALLALCILAVVVLLAAVIFTGQRSKLLLAGLLLAGVAAVACLALAHYRTTGSLAAWRGLAQLAAMPSRLDDVVGWFGCGEEAFAREGLWAGSSGLAIVGAATGWVGLLALVVGLATAWLAYFVQARKAAVADQPRIIAWLVACACCTAALLSRGGLFIPVFTLACAFAWGLMPTMLGLLAPRRKGSSLLIVMICLTILLGLVRNDGVLAWAVGKLGGADKVLHASVCFLASLAVAWHVGARKHWLAMIGILAVIAAGGAGELAQKVTSTRNMEFMDWFYDTVGSLAAAVIYLLAVACRLCESPDAKPLPRDGAY